jgi:bifunctional DNA-binding transcriptional regulator/antitoxin component of YhaV-PrlF toxin-antitoxin module
MSPIGHSTISTTGQVSVLVAVRRRLGIGPGAVLEWNEEGGNIVVRRAGRYSFDDIHRALFPKRTRKPKTLEQLKEGIRRSVRKHAGAKIRGLSHISRGGRP